MKIETPGCANLVLPIKQKNQKRPAFCPQGLGIDMTNTHRNLQICAWQKAKKMDVWTERWCVGCTNKV